MKENEVELLRKIVVDAQSNKSLPFDVSRIEKIIKEKISATLEKNAPPNFPELYFDFEYIYNQFYDFLIFNRLIGKKIVALGGSFNSGKSSFLNSLLGDKKILPTSINPSTSVPAYVIDGENDTAGGINVFSAKIEMNLQDVKIIAHRFGESEDGLGELTLGHLLRSIFVSTPNQSYSNIAFLDTPGYSKPDSENYSAKTDEKIARSQLNSADYILWFVAAETGTIKADDVKFLAELDKDIPKLIILNKVDKVANSNDLMKLRENIKSTLELRGISHEGIFTYSNKTKVECEKVKVREILSRLNERQGESDFARRFKKLFVACKNFYDDGLNDAKRQLSRLNKALTFSDNTDINDCLNDLVTDTKKSIQELENLKTTLHDIQQEFFTEIKIVADKVNIKMPEPSEIELLEDKITDPQDVVKKMLSRRNIKPDEQFLHAMQRDLKEVAPQINQSPGGIEYKNVLLETMKGELQ